MKRIIYILCLICLSMSLVGCTDGNALSIINSLTADEWITNAMVLYNPASDTYVAMVHNNLGEGVGGFIKLNSNGISRAGGVWNQQMRDLMFYESLQNGFKPIRFNEIPPYIVSATCILLFDMGVSMVNLPLIIYMPYNIQPTVIN